MPNLSADTHKFAPATRGQIVQRVLVDGWSTAQAAASFGIGERQVVRWVAAYRRHGMASLRDEGTAEHAPSRWLRRLRIAIRRTLAAQRPQIEESEPTPFVIARRRGGDGSLRR
jgi:transposase